MPMSAGSPTSSAPLSFAVTTPIHIHSAGLRVRDLDLMTDFYSRVIGMDIISRNATETILGKDGVVLFHLVARPDAEPDDERTAGLFHTAFLMPSRRDLGEWLIFAAGNQITFTGASDHLVSEALYLDDPEGNGIEVYADRPPESWAWTNDLIGMATEPLDLDNLVEGLPREARTDYAAPPGLRIGHMHLRVGQIDRAEAFYVGVVGLERTQRLQNSATFLASGRYHHHLGANIWHSRDAGRRDDKRLGLDFVGFSVAEPLMDGLRSRLKASGDDFHEQGNMIEAVDPWSTRVRFIPAARPLSTAVS
jgi:catechol 2,3-dioxygenase